MPQREISWIGLNPSTADENQLDPTLRRIKGFSQFLNFNSFNMLNLFAFRATNPKDMLKAEDPIGKDNDFWIHKICKNAELVIVCWGTHPKDFKQEGRLARDLEVQSLINPTDLHCLGFTKDGCPAHPLYLPASADVTPYST